MLNRIRVSIDRHGTYILPLDFFGPECFIACCHPETIDMTSQGEVPDNINNKFVVLGRVSLALSFLSRSILLWFLFHYKD